MVCRDESMNPFDAASPLDARYYFAEPDFFEQLNGYVSEGAQIKYMGKVEAALAETLAEINLAPQLAAKDIKQACERITPEEVYEEERRIQHNVRALVNCIRRKV